MVSISTSGYGIIPFLAARIANTTTSTNKIRIKENSGIFVDVVVVAL